MRGYPFRIEKSRNPNLKELVGMKRIQSERRITSCLRLGLVSLVAVSLGGCALTDKRALDFAREIAELNDHSAAPPGYPYPPEGLWRRLMLVIKTHPDELSYRKFGQIFGLEFDEDKMLWYGDRVEGKYFLVSKRAVKNVESFPFSWIDLSQGKPAIYTNRLNENWLTRNMSADFDLFAYSQDRQAMLDLSEVYCVKPKHSDIEALGYAYDKTASEFKPNYHGIRPKPYREEAFVDDVDSSSIAHRYVGLKLLANGCLVGISFSNTQKF